jgi:hypothetical protein
MSDDVRGDDDEEEEDSLVFVLLLCIIAEDCLFSFLVLYDGSWLHLCLSLTVNA